MNKKLFCTFVTREHLDKAIEIIKQDFHIKYNKLFILYSPDNNEYAITYNVEEDNVQNPLSNTILVHRKKDYNTLYTINSLNQVIKNMNNGVLDKSLTIPWDLYRNCILLTEGDKLKRINTKLHKVVSF